MNAAIAYSLATLARKSRALNGIGSTITSMETTGALMAHAPQRGKPCSVPKDLSSTISISVSSRRALPEPQALTPGSAISEGAAHGRLRRFVFGSSVSGDSAAYRAYGYR
jgi:hypothetical protein